jgi:hypothetical protein
MFVLTISESVPAFSAACAASGPSVKDWRSSTTRVASIP